MTDSTDSERTSSRTSAMDEWDAVFESNDPTRVLNPVDLEQTQSTTAGSRFATTVDEETDETEATQEFQAITSHSKTPYRDRDTAAAAAVPSAVAYKSSVEPDTVEAHESEPSYVYEEQSLESRFGRLQLVSILMGWLVSYASLQLLSTVGRDLLALFNAHDFGVVGNLLPIVQKDAAAATPWLVALGFNIFLAYLLGGYTAARLARYAATKQGVGVFILGFIATLIASGYVLLTHPLNLPTVSYQYLSHQNFNTGLIGVLAYFAVALIGALLGALCGKRYERIHRKAS